MRVLTRAAASALTALLALGGIVAVAIGGGGVRRARRS